MDILSIVAVVVIDVVVIEDNGDGHGDVDEGGESGDGGRADNAEKLVRSCCDKGW